MLPGIYTGRYNSDESSRVINSTMIDTRLYALIKKSEGNPKREITTGNFLTSESHEKKSKRERSVADTLKLLEAHLVKAKRVLDVGSHSGYMTLAIAKLMTNFDAIIYRIETDSNLRNKVKANIEKNNWKYLVTGKIVFTEGYVRNDLKDYEFYDVIYVRSLLAKGLDELPGEIPDKLSQKFTRRLAKGGRMVISGFLELLVVDKDKDGRITKQLIQHPSKIKSSKEFNKTNSQIKESILTKCHRAPEKRRQKLQTNAFKGTPIRENDTSLKVITQEKRQHLKKTDQFPFSAVGLLKVIIENQDPLTGTGVLVGPNILLTAAHNIVDNRDRSKMVLFTNIEFIPGMNEGMAPFGTSKVISSFVPEEFLKTGEKEDYALLVLDRDVGIEAGYFGIHAVNLSDLRALRKNKEEIFIFGYPGYVLSEHKEMIWLSSKGVHQLWGMGSNDWIIEEESQYISYEILTSPGQSGGGVFYKSGDSVYVLGIHVIGSEELNTATWMTVERYEKIQKFFKQEQLDEGKENLSVGSSDELLKSLTVERYAHIRITKEFNEFFKDPIPDIFWESASGNQIFGRFNGPGDSPYQGGIFKFVIEIPENYPFRAPKVNLLTKIFHPNIECSGIVCMSILMNELEWNPVLTLSTTILSMVSLLTSPNTYDSAEPEISWLYSEEKVRYEAIAREWTLKYAV